MKVKSWQMSVPFSILCISRAVRIWDDKANAVLTPWVLMALPGGYSISSGKPLITQCSPHNLSCGRHRQTVDKLNQLRDLVFCEMLSH